MELTNAQKLALPPSTPVGTVVHVSDGFVVSGDTRWAGLYILGGTINGKGDYLRSGGTTDDHCYWHDDFWDVTSGADGSYIQSIEDTTNPWDVVLWDNGPSGATFVALTHPAVQTLAAPSSAQGGVAVLGGTQDGVYPVRETVSGKDSYNLLGAATDPDTLSISWDETRASSWSISDGDGASVYYSTSDVASPDLVPNTSGAGGWKNASDDSPASITVTSVSVGELYAGLLVSNDGSTNGSSYVLQPFHGRQYYMGLNGGGSNNMHWDTDYNVWTDDVGVWTTDNVIFPWQGSDNGGGGHTGATFARNDVANEANWQTS